MFANSRAVGVSEMPTSLHIWTGGGRNFGEILTVANKRGEVVKNQENLPTSSMDGPSELNTLVCLFSSLPDIAKLTKSVGIKNPIHSISKQL